MLDNLLELLNMNCKSFRIKTLYIKNIIRRFLILKL